jgi:MYXO-CTERM domain-containing protein
MTYGIPGSVPSRHIVFDAPESATGTSTVSAAVKDGRCVINITAGDGFAGRPLVFTLSSAADGCAATEGTAVAPADGGTGKGVPGIDGGVASDGGVDASRDGSSQVGTSEDGGATVEGGTTSPSDSGSSGGCSCRVGGDGRRHRAAVATMILGFAILARRRRSRSIDQVH